MKRSTTFHCEGPGCDRWAASMHKRPEAWMVLSEGIGQDKRIFCGWDCLLRYGAQFEPEEVIPA